MQAGCLFNPGNDKEVCGANHAVTISGFVPQPSATITIEASTSPTGPFASIGSATSGSAPLTISGETYYSFQDSVTIDEWSSSPTELTVYVRARMGGFDLLTFEEQNGSGQTGLECVLAGISAGDTPSVAAAACDRNDPVLAINAPLESTCPCAPYSVVGDLEIGDARSAAEAQCVTDVSGDLRVLDGAPDLVSLTQLTSVGGNAELSYQLPYSAGPMTAYRNRAVDLGALTTIGGNVDIVTRRGSGQSKTLDTMTAAVTSIGGDVTISTYDNNVTAFAGVTSVSGSITLQGYTGASGNLDIFGSGTFPNLTSVGNDLTVQGFFACNSVFNSVESVAGDLTVRSVRLAPLQSFSSLETVSGNLRFETMKQFGPTWPVFTSVGQDLQLINNTPLVSLSSVPVGAIDVNGIAATDNVNLTTLDGSLQAGTGDITIDNSPALSQCDVDTWLAAQTAGGWSGSDSITGVLACP